MLKKIFGIGFLLVIVAGTVYVGMAIYANFFQKPSNSIEELKLPDKADAAYSVAIKNTGGLMLTSTYEQFGQEAGSRTFVLHGVWERTGQDFVYHKADFTLDEKIWGIITVKRRE